MADKNETEVLRKGIWNEDSSDGAEDAVENPEKEGLFDVIQKKGESWAPGLRITILGIICFIAISARVFSIIRYESVIHEFDPWFNYRATKVLAEKGYYAFKFWHDQESWYPLGRYSGATLFPGLMLTAWVSHMILTKILMIPLDIREVCVFTAPFFSALTSITGYLLAKEATGKTEAGFLSALFVAVIPTYMSRSVAGSYDNEAVAIFALVFSFYTFVKSLNSGSMIDALVASFAYYYMVLTWGGYVFVQGFMSIFIVILIFLGRFNAKAYITFSTIYIVGNLLSLNVPFVSIWAVWQSSEHLPSHIAFILCQFYFIRAFLQKRLTKENFDLLTLLLIRMSIFAVLSVFIYIIVMGKTTAGHRILTLINPVYAKKHNPLVASISEHQATAWPSMFFDVHYMLFFAPIGAYYCLKKVKNSKLFIVLYCLIGTYFSSIMIRLMLVSGPSACVLSGIGLSYILRKICQSIKAELRSLTGQPVPKKKGLISFEFAIIGLILVCVACCKAVFHGTWAAAEAYSHPSIIMAYNQGDRRVIVDDYREAYEWLRKNTKPTARVMSWWDYGYQIAGMGNRTTIVDNNTWNKTHIGRVGMIMGSREEEAFELAKQLDVDYVLVVFGGVSGYSGDDINKFLWMVRIGGSENSHIKESDYYSNGQYRVDAGGSRTMLNCLMYKLCYYRFSEINLGKGPGYDQQRRAYIGNPDFKLKYFEEAYTTENWILRIYRVKSRSNTGNIDYSDESLSDGIQQLSGLTESQGANPFAKTRYTVKNVV